MNKSLTLALLVMGCGAEPMPGEVPVETPVEVPSEAPVPRAPECTERVDSPADTSLAIDGYGWFVLDRGFTRFGQFQLDEEGHLATRFGNRVRGIDELHQLVELKLRPLTLPARATSRVQLDANLDARTTPSATYFDPSNPWGTSNFQSSTSIYDGLGVAHTADVFFQRTVAGWDWHVMTDGGGVQGGTAGTPSEIAAGTMAFDFKGVMTANTRFPSITFNPVGAQQPQELFFDLRLTQFGSASSNLAMFQDGIGAGTLDYAEPLDDGTIIGHYSNGEEQRLGRIALANFSLDRALQSIGEHTFAETTQSGPAIYGAPRDRQFGALRWHALEVPCAR